MRKNYSERNRNRRRHSIDCKNRRRRVCPVTTTCGLDWRYGYHWRSVTNNFNAYCCDIWTLY